MPPSAISAFASHIPDLWKSGVFHADFGLYIKTFGFILLGCILHDYYQSWNKLKHIKGPLTATHSKLWLIRAVGGGKEHEEFMKVNNKYGMCILTWLK